MPEYSDIYVISNNRSIESINKYLDHFLPNREESAIEYVYPQFSEKPELITTHVSEILELCVENSNVEYSVYWRSIGGTKPGHAMVFFLNDGYIIFGLSTDASDEVFAKSLLEKLKVFLDSSHGYMTWEAAPDVSNYNEFLVAEKENAYF